MFNVKCCKLRGRGSLKFFKGMLLNGHPGGLVFFEADCQKGGSIFLGGYDLHRNYGMILILLFLLFNYDNLTLKLHLGKRSYPDEAWLFTGRFKVGSVPGMSVVLEASKKISKSIMSMMRGH